MPTVVLQEGGRDGELAREEEGGRGMVLGVCGPVDYAVEDFACHL